MNTSDILLLDLFPRYNFTDSPREYIKNIDLYEMVLCINHLQERMSKIEELLDSMNGERSVYQSHPISICNTDIQSLQKLGKVILDTKLEFKPS